MKQLPLKRPYRFFLLMAAAVGFLIFLIRVRHILLPFCLAVVLAYLLHPLVNLLERRLPRTIAILIVYASLLGFIALVGVFFVPLIIGQLLRLAEMLPFYIEQVQGFIQYLDENFQRAPLPEVIRTILDERLRLLEAQLLNLISQIVEKSIGVFSNIFNIVLAPIFAFYILNDIDRIRRGFLSLIPARYKSGTLNLLNDVDKVIGGYVRGQLIVAAITGTMIGVGMSLLGMRFAALLGFIAAISDFIPYFGPFIGAVPAVSLGLLRSPVSAIYVAATFILIQQIEAVVVAPRVVSAHVGLHPLVVIFSLLVGAELFGIPGLVLAVPTAAALRVTFIHIGKQLM
ncbi:MAG: AI-2E family transporter [bacterium]|jgi:predicted PurR-regulated permease PerM